MPWFPEFASAAELARQQTRAAEANLASTQGPRDSYPDALLTCAATGRTGGGMSAICIRSAKSAAS